MDYPPTEKYQAIGAPLPAGEYVVKIKEITETDDYGEPFTDKHGFKYARFEYSVKDFPNNSLFDRFCFNEENPNANINLGKFKSLQEAIGVPVNTGGSFNDLIGKVCMVKTKVTNHNDKSYANITSYKPYDGSLGEVPETTKPEDDLPF